MSYSPDIEDIERVQFYVFFVSFPKLPLFHFSFFPLRKVQRQNVAHLIIKGEQHCVCLVLGMRGDYLHGVVVINMLCILNNFYIGEHGEGPLLA